MVGPTGPQALALAAEASTRAAAFCAAYAEALGHPKAIAPAPAPLPCRLSRRARPQRSSSSFSSGGCSSAATRSSPCCSGSSAMCSDLSAPRWPWPRGARHSVQRMFIVLVGPHVDRLCVPLMLPWWLRLQPPHQTWHHMQNRPRLSRCWAPRPTLVLCCNLGLAGRAPVTKRWCDLGPRLGPRRQGGWTATHVAEETLARRPLAILRNPFTD